MARYSRLAMLYYSGSQQQRCKYQSICSGRGMFFYPWLAVLTNSCRQVSIRFANNDNLTAVVDGFVNFYEIDEVAEINIFRTW